MEEALRRRLSGDFPYKRNFLEAPAVLFARLQEQALFDIVRAPHPVWRYPGGFGTVHIVVSEDAYGICDALVDHFTEEVRVRSRVKGRWTPHETWEWFVASSPERLVATAMEIHALEDASDPTYLLREAVYRLSWECTQFKVTLARAIWSFCIREVGTVPSRARLLDPCAGWGDRLVGALSLNAAEYVGVDPNPRLREGHERAAAELQSSTKAALHTSPFEDVQGLGEFDVVFTSPPFADYETYWSGVGGDARQCNVRFPDDRWASEWLCPAVLKMYQHLRPGGVLALHLSDTSAGRVCAMLCAHMNAQGCRLHGTVACRRGEKRAMPLWIWKRPLTEEISC